MSRFDTLSDWLNWLEQLHPKSIDLGLERVYQVAIRLNLLKSSSLNSHAFSGQLNLQCKNTVITVAGTNGKGSCIATLEQSLLLFSVPQKNLTQPKVGAYSSPHLHHYCERIRIDGKPVSEDVVCDAFEVIDQARGLISLTYFEFGTLAALFIFTQYAVPTVLLEVGLGGRLDAVNIVDADIAIITSIDLDHQDWLGDNREVISQEKLGIARPASLLIIAESHLTPSLTQAAKRESSFCLGRDFSCEVVDSHQWCFGVGLTNNVLPLPALSLPSVAAALVVLQALNQLPKQSELVTLMGQLFLPGRFEHSTVRAIEVIYDVAHNPAAVKVLAKRLMDSASSKVKTYAVIAMMGDKDHAAILQPMLDIVDMWFLGDLSDHSRAASARMIADKLRAYKVGEANIFCQPTIPEAFESALKAATRHDRIAVFGSFYTVAAVQSWVAEELGVEYCENNTAVIT